MDKEQMLKFVQSVQARLEQTHDMCVANKETMKKLGCSLVLSFFVDDKPGYMSAQGDGEKLFHNVTELVDNLKENVWKKQDTKS